MKTIFFAIFVYPPGKPRPKLCLGEIPRSPAPLRHRDIAKARSGVRHSLVNLRPPQDMPKVRGRKASFQMLFRVQGQLDHPLEQVVCLKPGEIVTNEFLAEQVANITKLAALLFAGIHEVSVSIVDQDDVLVCVEL